MSEEYLRTIFLCKGLQDVDYDTLNSQITFGNAIVMYDENPSYGIRSWPELLENSIYLYSNGLRYSIKGTLVKSII